MIHRLNADKTLIYRKYSLKKKITATTIRQNNKNQIHNGILSTHWSGYSKTQTVTEKVKKFESLYTTHRNVK